MGGMTVAFFTACAEIEGQANQERGTSKQKRRGHRTLDQRRKRAAPVTREKQKKWIVSAMDGSCAVGAVPRYQRCVGWKDDAGQSLAAVSNCGRNGC